MRSHSGEASRKLQLLLPCAVANGVAAPCDEIADRVAQRDPLQLWLRLGIYHDIFRLSFAAGESLMVAVLLPINT